MKGVLTIIIIGSFLAIAVFGILAMDGHRGSTHGGCIAAMANGALCPDENNPLASAVFHLSAFKNFTTATFVNMASLLLLALAFIYYLFSRSLLDDWLHLPGNIFFAVARTRRSLPLETHIRHWLALHENSPAAL